MDILCTADMCPVILNATCVFYEGNNLIYTGITTNDSLQTALQKIDAKFGDANVGYIFTNGVYQPTAGSAVGLGGALTSDTSIGGNYTLTFTGNVKAAKHITTGGTASQFVKGDGTLDSTAYQAAGNYITALTGDVIAAGPGSAAASLAVVNTNPGTYGSGTRIPVVTVDTKGRVTALTTTAIVVPSGSLSFVGDVYGSGTTGSQTTLTLTNVNSNVYTNNTFLKFKVNAKGLVTGAAPITHVDIEGVLGYVPVPETRTITINGTTHDLQANVVFSLPGGGTVQSVSVTAGTGISASVANPTINPNITITNTAPDQVVTITGQSGIDVTGTYPNFTISANEEGAVTSVTASAPLASSGGQTPNITITKADLTTDGYLSSADWSTFNAKQYALNGTGLVRMDGTTVSYDNTAYTPQSRTLTINGVSYDLAADRSWTINSMVYPEAGIAVSTGTGWGTSLVDNSANWNTAYSERISSASSPLSIASNAISISQAGASTNGYLSSTDWNTFNNKQASGNYITDLTGEATASGPGSATVTLSTPAVTSKLLTGVNITGGSIVATDSILTAFGKVQNQINGLIGGTIYKGVWNASTNTPALASGVGTLGWYYIVNVPGTTNLDGITDWHLGDWAIFDGLAWQQVDNTDAVVSVNGYTGAVSLVSSDIPEGLTNLYWTSTRFNTAFSGKTTTDLTEGTQLYYTDGRARSAISLTTTGTSGAATYDNSTGVLNIPQYQGGVTSFNTRTGAITLLDTDVTTALGYTPVTNARTLTINGTTYDLTANRSWTVSGTMPAGGTAGQILSKIDATDYNTQWIDNFASQVKNIVKLGAALAKGTPVYVSGADGTNMIVSASSNTTEAGSSKTFGLLEAGGVLNDQVECVTYGLIDGLDTSAANAAGDPVWLGPNGTLLYGLANKPVAPAHMVYIGVVTRKQSNNGEIFVNIQNGFEVDELHDVLISAPKTDGQGLFLQTIAGIQLWRNRTIADVLGYTPANAATYVPYTGATTDLVLGANNFSAKRVSVLKSSDGFGGFTSNYLYLGTGTSTTSVGTDGISLYSKPNIRALIITYDIGGVNYSSTLDASSLTANRSYTLPDASGTLALTSSLSSYVPTSRTLTINGVTYDLSADRSWSIAAGVTSFNTRTGAITLTSGDVTTALGYTPVTDARTLTINGTTYDLTANRSWTIAPSSAARVEETFTATAGQTVFTVTGGYIVGLVDVYVNGVKYAPADYTATNGTTVVLNTGVVAGDIVDIINYTATIAALPTSRDVFDYTATAAQTTFTVSGGYVVGLLDVYVNGVKLTSSEVTATNGTTFVLTVASVAGDQVQAIRYNTSVNGVSGSGTTGYISKFTASATLGNSGLYDNGTGFYGFNTTSVNASINAGGVTINGGVGSSLTLQLAGVNKMQLYHSVSYGTNLIGFENVYIGAGTDLILGGFQGDGIKITENGQILVGPGGQSFLPVDDGTTLLQLNGAIKAGAANLAGPIDYTPLTVRNLNNGNYYVGINFESGTDKATSAIRSYRTNSSVDYQTALTFWTKGTGAGPTTPTERMRIAPNGNVGIGTITPQGGAGANDRTLSVNSGAGAASFVTGLVGDVKYSTLFTASSIVVLETNAAIPLAFNTNGAEAMRITSGRQVGIRATPTSGWGSAMSALQIGTGGVLSNWTGANNNFQVGVNYYDNGAGSQLRLNTGGTSKIDFGNDVISFSNAGSNSAGTPIAFTTRMTIQSDGGVVIGRDLGNQYSQTSSTGTTSIVDTGITYNTGDYGGFNRGATYQVVFNGNPNAGGSGYYFAQYMGIITVYTGWSGSAVTTYINYTQLASGNNISTLTLTAHFWNGSSQVSSIGVYSSGYQIRLRIDGYNSSYVGQDQSVYLKRLS